MSDYVGFYTARDVADVMDIVVELKTSQRHVSELKEALSAEAKRREEAEADAARLLEELRYAVEQLMSHVGNKKAPCTACEHRPGGCVDCTEWVAVKSRMAALAQKPGGGWE